MTTNPALDFQQIATELDLDPEELRNAYEALLRSHERGLPSIMIDRSPTVKSLNNCLTDEFRLELPPVVVEGKSQVCLDQCWSARLDVTVKLLGIPVAKPTSELSCRNTEACISVDLKLARAKLCLGIRGGRLCSYVRGEAGYFHPTKGWTYARFDETLFCLKSDGQSSHMALATTAGDCGCGK